jgi:hypothetical protein
MPAHGGKDAVDRGIVHQHIGQRAGGGLEGGQLQCGLGHRSFVKQNP